MAAPSQDRDLKIFWHAVKFIFKATVVVVIIIRAIIFVVVVVDVVVVAVMFKLLRLAYVCPFTSAFSFYSSINSAPHVTIIII